MSRKSNTSRFRRTRHSERARGVAAVHRRLWAELLEDRRLLAVSFNFQHASDIHPGGVGFEDSTLGQARRDALVAVGTEFGAFFDDFGTIDVAVNSDYTDFNAKQETVNFNGTAGESQTFSVDVLGDTTVEPDELFRVALGGLTDLPTNVSTNDFRLIDGLGTITNEDGYTLTVSNVAETETNSGTSNFIFNVTLDKAVSGGFKVKAQTQVDTAVSPSDFTATATTLTFAGTAGETNTFIVPVVGDTSPEQSEQFGVVLTSLTDLPSGVTENDFLFVNGTGTINNNDGFTLTVSDVSQNESDSATSTFDFTITLDKNVGGSFKVNAATQVPSDEDAGTSGSDYVALGPTQLSFAGTANEQKTISVTVNGDTETEEDELFDVVLSGLTDLPNGVTPADFVLVDGRGTINNDDGFTLTVSDVTQAETNSGTTTFDFTVTLDKAISGGFKVQAQTDGKTATSSSTLASAGSSRLSGPSGFIHAVAAVKALTGHDLNGSETADAVVNVNWARSWELADDFQDDDFDFTSVIMHELAHALGFSSEIALSGASQLNGAQIGNPGRWSVFDSFVSDSVGVSLIDADTFVLDAAWNTHRTGGTSPDNGLFFNGYNAQKANSGNPVGLYSPTTWNNGSSGSHLDSLNPTYESLMMRHWVSEGRAERQFDDIEKGIFRDLGYTIAGVANVAPVGVGDSGLDTDEDTPVLITNVLHNDFDPDPGETEGIRIESLDTSSTVGAATLVGTGLPTQFTYTGPMPIADNSTTNFDLEVTNFSGRLTDIDVTLDITHSYNADLDVYLVSPSGTRVELFTDVYVPEEYDYGTGFRDTRLSDEAILPIAESGTWHLDPFTSIFRPEGLLADFEGEDANGTWTLEVSDDAFLDDGILDDWSLILRGQHIEYDPNGQFELLNDGDTQTDTLSYTVKDSRNATSTATVTVEVTGITDATSLAIGDTSAVKTEGNSGTTPFTFTVTRRGRHAAAAPTVNYAVSGSGKPMRPTGRTSSAARCPAAV